MSFRVSVSTIANYHFRRVLQQNLDKAGDLLEEAGQCSSGTSLKDLAKSLKQHLRGFSDRLEETRERLEDTSRCFYLLDKVRFARLYMNFRNEKKIIFFFFCRARRLTIGLWNV